MGSLTRYNPGTGGLKTLLWFLTRFRRAGGQDPVIAHRLLDFTKAVSLAVDKVLGAWDSLPHSHEAQWGGDKRRAVSGLDTALSLFLRKWP